jgi:hypothetical protein
LSAAHKETGRQVVGKLRETILHNFERHFLCKHTNFEFVANLFEKLLTL